MEKFKEVKAATRSHHGIQELDQEHFDSDRNELDGRKLCWIKVPRSSIVSEWVRNDIDPPILTFDHALDVTMITREQLPEQ